MIIASHPGLAEKLRREASLPGGIPFSRFMGLALYHPEWGYYASGLARTGRSGDFFTSVSVGETFGLLLARRIAAWWEETGRPEKWRLLEQGAHDGQLMNDVLTHLPAACRSGVAVEIIEPSPTLLAKQQVTLANWKEFITWSNDFFPAGSGHVPAVYFANELLDAFPVERIIHHQGHWMSLNVVADNHAPDGFAWCPMPLPEAWREYMPSRESGWIDGQVTEICPALGEWVRGLRRSMPCGLVLLADYGFEENDYFHPSRMEGTLRTYHRHQAPDNPFIGIGHCDITAHVNWSPVARLLERAGYAVSGPVDQGRWLTRVGSDWLLGLEKSVGPETGKWVRQFQTLIHPQHLGGKFQVLEARV